MNETTLKNKVKTDLTRYYPDLDWKSLWEEIFNDCVSQVGDNHYFGYINGSNELVYRESEVDYVVSLIVEECEGIEEDFQMIKEDIGGSK